MLTKTSSNKSNESELDSGQCTAAHARHLVYIHQQPTLRLKANSIHNPTSSKGPQNYVVHLFTSFLKLPEVPDFSGTIMV